MGGTYERVLTQREVETNEVSTESIRQASATLNRPIALQETVNSLKTLRSGKAVRIDNIANEILKVQTIQNCQHSLFASCFEYGMVPRIWLQRIIHPILKRGKNPLFPTNHRGISLMSTVYKAFNFIIINRIVLYTELNGLFVDEQNGFRWLRSCLDNIYILTTIQWNRKQQGLPTLLTAVSSTSKRHSTLWDSPCCGIKCLHVVSMEKYSMWSTATTRTSKAVWESMVGLQTRFDKQLACVKATH